MENIKANIKVVILLVIILAVLGFYIYNDIRGKSLGGQLSPETPLATTTIQATGDYTLEEIPLSPELLAGQPDLDRKIIFGPGVTNEVKNSITSNVNKLVTELKENPGSPNNWIALGVQFKLAGDFMGAKEAWEYAALLSPSYYVPYNNLGNLYMYFIKNNRMAEESFRKAVQANPNIISSYRAFYELYRFSYTEKSHLADDILLEGLSKNPKSTDLMILLAQYYKEMADKDKARTYYQKALAEAKAQGNISLATLIEKEIENL